MVKFGYTINADRQIDYDRNSRDFSRLLAELEPSLNICFSCGSCTATCTAGAFTELSLRRLILLAKRGETSLISEQAEKCMLCGKCQLVCPRGVNTRNLILGMHRAIQKLSR